MNASEALGRLKRLRVPAATTADARSGARFLRHCDQSPSETTWPRWFGDSLAEREYGPWPSDRTGSRWRST